MSLMSSSSRGTPIRFVSSFTLVEMIVAVAIVGIIAAVVYGSLWGVTRTIGDTREKMELHQAARCILWRMSEEISNAFINERNSFTSSDAESNYYCDSDSISFISTSKASGPEQQGTCSIEYYIVGETLFKSVDGTLSTIIEDADDLDLSYFDGTDWREDWDHLGGRLPKMIEVNLWLKGEPFSVTVSVPLTKVYEK